ncbi:MAG: prepilin-type N-terminal cleavage/methylation domain-containing protein [bacterium]
MSGVRKISSKKGFTLLEILLVVGIIAILAGIVILAINPTRQLGQARNAQRRSDVLTIMNAVYQYAIDNQGNVPNTIPTNAATSTICIFGTAGLIDKTAAGGHVDLYTSLVGATSTYITAVPSDPNINSSDSETGYHIGKLASGRIFVCAPSAEQNETIMVTR